MTTEPLIYKCQRCDSAIAWEGICEACAYEEAMSWVGQKHDRRSETKRTALRPEEKQNFRGIIRPADREDSRPKRAKKPD